MRHAAFLAKSGQVHATGCNKKGQLGVGPEVTRAHSPAAPVLDSAVEIECGQNFTLARRADGVIVGFGDNKYGQIGLSHGPRCFRPVPIQPVPPNEKVISISCGWTHLVCLTESGSVLTRGRNTYGQLGRPDDGADSRAQVMKRVTSVSSGYEHVLAVTESQELVVWGWNEHGNCGLNGTANVTLPRKLEGFSGHLVTKCFGGSGHSFCTTNKT